MTQREERPFDVPPPDPELRRLEPLTGSWTSEDHTEDTVVGPGVPVKNQESFRWFDGGYFLVQDYETVFGDEPAQRGVNYWWYDSDSQRFRIIFFSNNGPFTEEGNQYQGKVAEGKLTFVGPARFQYELDNEGKVKINSDDAVSVAWWIRGENGAWESWMNNTFRRV